MKTGYAVKMIDMFDIVHNVYHDNLHDTRYSDLLGDVRARASCFVFEWAWHVFMRGGPAGQPGGRPISSGAG